jgi:hypothetical protein
MQEYQSAPLEKYVYNQFGTTLVGGYPIQELLKKEDYKYSEGMVGGGSKHTRFENLVIPAGLLAFSDEYFNSSNSQGDSQTDVTMEGGGKKATIKINKDCDVIDPRLFDKVFDMITKCHGLKPLRTKSNRPGKSGTRKRK